MVRAKKAKEYDQLDIPQSSRLNTQGARRLRQDAGYIQIDIVRPFYKDPD